MNKKELVKKKKRVFLLFSFFSYFLIVFLCSFLFFVFSFWFSIFSLFLLFFTSSLFVRLVFSLFLIRSEKKNSFFFLHLFCIFFVFSFFVLSLFFYLVLAVFYFVFLFSAIFLIKYNIGGSGTPHIKEEKLKKAIKIIKIRKAAKWDKT